MSSPHRFLLAAALVTLATFGPGKVDGDDKLKDLIKSRGYIEIKLVEAHVPDLDPLPMQRDSDVFARVYLNDTKEIICETPVIQDENKPKVSVYFRFRYYTSKILILFCSVLFYFILFYFVLFCPICLL